MRQFFALLVPLTIILISGAGCYTILKHPATEEGYTGHDYQQDCMRCHPDYHDYPYGYFYGDYPNYWWSTPRWGHYYASPWWWDYYWYDGRNDYDYSADTSSLPTVGGTKEARRDVLRPPYTNGPLTPSLHLNESVPPPNSSSDNVGSKTPPPESKPDSKKEEKEKDDGSAGKKEPRRGGGPGR